MRRPTESITSMFQGEQSGSAPWWLFWLLLIIALISVGIAFLMRRKGDEYESPGAPLTPPAKPDDAALVQPSMQAVAPASAAPAGAGEAVAPAAAQAPAVVAAKTEPVEEQAPAEPVAETESAPEDAPVEPTEPEAATEAETEPETPVEPDDLTKIEGIGPKISTWLNEAGITTFAQLADHSPEQLAEILQNAGHRSAATSTWPEQAALAAADNWDDLKKLQNELHGGRRK